MLLAQVMALKKKACVEAYSQIADTFGADRALLPTECADEVVRRICELVRVLEIPTDLSAYYFSRDDIEFLTDLAFAIKRLLD